MKVAFEKSKSRFDFSAWFKCVIVALGLIIVAYFIELSNALLFSTAVSNWVKLVYYVGLTFIIGSIIWLILYISPRLFRSLLSSDSTKQPQSQSQQAPIQTATNQQPAQTYPSTSKTEPASAAQVHWVPVYPETPAPSYEETESEKLRREFRNRSF